MTSHRNINKLLYDYVAGTLSPEERRIVDEHISFCHRCRRDKIIIEQTTGYLSIVRPKAEGRFNTAYWNILAGSVLDNPRKQNTPSRNFAVLRSAYIGATAIIISLFIFIYLYHFQIDAFIERDAADTLESTDPFFEQYAAFIERSKMLLTGFMNAEPYNGNIDITVERAVARELADDTRRLLAHPYDDLTTDLIHELQIIHRKIANLDDGDAGDKLTFLQSIIQERNLLFRIRMEELIIQSDPTILAGVY
jgi:hypothetical protein